MVTDGVVGTTIATLSLRGDPPLRRFPIRDRSVDQDAPKKIRSGTPDHPPTPNSYEPSIVSRRKSTRASSFIARTRTVTRPTGVLPMR